VSSPDLHTELCGIPLRNPLVNGSGTLDALAAGTLGLGAFVTKTVTLRPRAGNPPVRIAETPAGMVNSIGLANPGLDAFCADQLPRLGELGVPVIASVGGWSPS
jgi:dihydroorotate dehydrogenase (NAD+) catalytic subunit